MPASYSRAFGGAGPGVVDADGQPEGVVWLTGGSPAAQILQPEVVTWCAMNNIVIIPGCQTPTEAYNAYKAGAPVQKIFLGVAGGAAWVGAVSKALPMLTLNPTSGVDLDNAGDFLNVRFAR